MADAVNQLLARGDVAKSEPAPRASIDELAGRFGAVLPAFLIELWVATDGVAFDSLDAHLLGPSEVILMIEEQAWLPGLVAQGFLPVFDDHQSNYVAVLVGGPLAFRVAYLPHDEGSRLLYRDIDSFLQALIEALNGDALPAATSTIRKATTHPTPLETRRTSAPRALMATDGTRDEWNYASQLLDASNPAEWAMLLETDHFVRRDVVARMEKMTDPAMRELLRRDRAAFEEFATRAAEAAREAGLKVGRREQGALQVGGKWINLEVFFHRRRIPDAIPRMLAWFEDLIAGRNPHDRPGHFMCD